MSSIGLFNSSPPYIPSFNRAEPGQPASVDPAATPASVAQQSQFSASDADSAAPLSPVAESSEGKGARAGQDEALVRQELAGKEAQLELVEQAEIRELATRDREVRAHEQAHMAVGGQYAGGVSYDYSRGPDGRLYATGGSVSIDISPVAGDPAATISKMQQVQRAALAPAEPSGQDRVVAAQAAQLIAQARSEIASASGTDGATSRTAGSREQGAEEQPANAEQVDAAPIATGVRELATYRQVDAPESPLSAGFRASA